MRYLLGLFALLSLTVYSLPYVIKDQTLIWLKQQGIDYPKLAEVSIQWHTGTLLLRGLKAEKPGKTSLKIDQLAVSLDYTSLFDKHLLIDSIELVGFSASIDKQANSFYFGPLDLNQLLNNDAEPDSPSTFKLGIKALQLKDIDFTINVSQQHHKLHIDTASLDNIYQWVPQQLSHFEVIGTLNGAPLNISTITAPLSLEKTTQFNLSLKNFPLASLTSPIVSGLSAKVDADIHIDFKVAGQSYALQHTGNFKLSDFKWHTELQKINFANLQWQGSGDLLLKNNKLSKTTIEGKLAIQSLAIDTRGAILKAAQINWQGPASADFNHAGIFELNVAEQLELSEVKIDKPIKLSIAHFLSKAGKTPLKINFKDNQIQSIETFSAVNLTKVLLATNNTNINFGKASLTQQKPLALTFSKGLLNSIQATPKINLSALSLKTEKLKIAANNTSLAGPINISRIDSNALISAALVHKTNVLNIQKDNLSVAAKALSIQIKLDKLDVTKPVIQGVDLTAAQLSIKDSSRALTLLSAAKLKLSDANYSPALTSFSQLDINQLRIAMPNEGAALSYVGSLAIHQLTFKENSLLNIANIALTNTHHQLHIDKDGNITRLNQLQKSLNSLVAADNRGGDSQSNDQLKYNINQLTISADNTIEIEDKSVDPWFKSHISLSKVRLGPINNFTDQLTAIEIQGLINKSAKVQFKGEYALFSDAKEGNWQLKLDALSLPVISPYSGKTSGYLLENGKLSLDSQGTISKGKITGKNKVLIQQLAVRSAQSNATKKTNQSLNMPLDLAISLLEDDEGNINLSVPIDGSLDDPNFGYSSIVAIIAKKGMKKAALGILTKSLQPYGALLSLATTVMDANQSGTFINLSPISFGSGNYQLSADMNNYLSKLAKMMKQRKKLKLKLCGNAVASDKTLINAAAIQTNAMLKEPLDALALNTEVKNLLQTLATERGEAVQKSLLKLGVASERLFVCFAKVTLKDAKQKPSVSLGL
ncbi:MAG: DUF748 domain-containing protein [Oceanospirillaceae bacterium]|nr:DUF748 domain-containing protein [Oceanospirillaceae bacterium]